MKKLILPAMALCFAAGVNAAENGVSVSAKGKLLQSDAGDAAKELKHFPAAAAGQVRHVIIVQPQADESRYKIEVVPGKNQMVDCNRQWFGATLTEKTVEGFGYNYYEVSDLTGPMSTMMGCLNNEKHDAFVSANLNDDGLLRYNSRLPLVVYAPEGVDVKYRIWRADEQLTDAPAK